MNIEQLIQQGQVPPFFTKKPHQAFHLSAQQHLSATELEQLLGHAQKGYDPRTDGIVIDYIAKLLNLDHNSTTAKAISQRDENIINFISLIFEQITKNAPEQTADLLAMLVIPFARLALKDESFISNEQHPARHTLDLLIHLSQSPTMTDRAFQLIQFYVTTITLRYNGQANFFEDINQQLDTYYLNFKPDLGMQLLQIEKQLDPKQKAASLNTLNKIYVSEILQVLPQQLSFTALLHHFLHTIFAQIAANSTELQQDWLSADTDISRFISLFNRRNLGSFREAHKQLADHIKTFNKYLQQIEVPLSLRRLFFEQTQQLLQFIVKGHDTNNIQDNQLKHSDALNLETDRLLQQNPSTLNENARFGYMNQASHEAFTQGQSADASSIVQLRMGQWTNIMIDGRRIPCQICFYAKQRQSFFFCSQAHQQLFERSGGDFVVDLQMGYAELLVRCNNIGEVFTHNLSYLQRYQSTK